jgi:hypothetical protein
MFRRYDKLLIGLDRQNAIQKISLNDTYMTNGGFAGVGREASPDRKLFVLNGF